MESLNGRLCLGLCCINTELRKDRIFCSRSCIRKNFTVEKAKELATQNVQDISKMIEWNHENDIRCLRLSSDIFPHFTDKETEKYTIDFAKKELAKAGKLARRYGHRVLTHPAQFAQVGAKTSSVFESTVADLSHHADILDAMRMSNNAIIIVHGGGTYGDKEATMRRWVEQFDDLPRNVKNRLVVENCERQYSTEDCLQLSDECKIPVVFDFHHYHCYNQIYESSREQESIEELLPQIVESWSDRIPVMHISEQKEGSRIGAHSDYISKLPKELITYMQEETDLSVDLEVEAKMKELAIKRLYDKYPKIFDPDMEFEL